MHLFLTFVVFLCVQVLESAQAVPVLVVDKINYEKTSFVDLFYFVTLKIIFYVGKKQTLFFKFYHSVSVVMLNMCFRHFTTSNSLIRIQ